MPPLSEQEAQIGMGNATVCNSSWKARHCSNRRIVQDREPWGLIWVLPPLPLFHRRACLACSHCAQNWLPMQSNETVSNGNWIDNAEPTMLIISTKKDGS